MITSVSRGLPAAASPLLPAVLRRQLHLQRALHMAHTPGARATPADAATPAAGIEVERKFLLPDSPEALEALRETIVAKGGALLKKITFTDSYWDSPGYDLTLKDFWLRQRDGAWELKVPGQHIGGTAVYTELETEPEIAAAVAAQLPATAEGVAATGAQTLCELLAQHTIEPCATFGTVRESFSLPGGFHVDLDVASFGYVSDSPQFLLCFTPRFLHRSSISLNFPPISLHFVRALGRSR